MTDTKLSDKERADLEAQVAAAQTKLEADKPRANRTDWEEGDRFQVVAPAIIVRHGTPDGPQMRHLYKGAILPHDVPEDQIEHHLNVTRQIVKLGDPKAEAALAEARAEAIGRGEDPDVVGLEGAPRWPQAHVPEVTGRPDGYDVADTGRVRRGGSRPQPSPGEAQAKTDEAASAKPASGSGSK